MIVPDVFPSHWVRPATLDSHLRLAEDAVRSGADRVAIEALRRVLDEHLSDGTPDYAARMRAARLVARLDLEDLL